MNLSQLITRIKITCGIYAIALPFENADEAIANAIELKDKHTNSPLERVVMN